MKYISKKSLLTAFRLLIISLFSVSYLYASTPLSALDQPFSRTNEVLIYPDSTTCAAQPETAQPAEVTFPEDGTNFEKVVNILNSKGELSLENIASIMGNLEAESAGINPNNPETGGSHWGIAQWDTTRQANLRAFAQNHNSSEKDVSVQAEFLWSEAKSGVNSFVLANFLNLNLKDGTTYWLNTFEGASGQANEKRQTEAKKALEKIEKMDLSQPIYSVQPAPTTASDTPNCASVCATNSISTSADTPVTSDLKSFVDAYLDYAVEANKQYGIPYETNLAQGLIESAYGKSQLSAKYFNFHGLKAGSTWDGPTVNLETQEEYTPGESTTISDDFRVFSDPKAGWLGYAQFITDNPRYSEALKYPGDPIKYLEEIKKAGYATDNQYIETVGNVVRSIQKYVKEKNLAPPSSEIVVQGGGAQTTSTGSPSVSDCTGSGVSGGTIVEIAERELTKKPKEWDANALKYTSGNRWAWCASFVSWVLNEAGTPLTGGWPEEWLIPGVSGLLTWFQSNPDKAEYFDAGSKTPQPGDIALYKNGASHTNIVVAVNGDKMTVIGGNQSNAVTKYVQSYQVGDHGLTGFGRMK